MKNNSATKNTGFIIKSVYALEAHETARWIREARNNPAQLLAFSTIFASHKAAIKAMKDAGLWNEKAPTCQIIDLSIFPNTKVLISK